MASMKKVSRLTYADLEQLPDEETRLYELFDGELVVLPAPSREHQIAVGNIYVILRQARPKGHLILFAPFDWYVDEGTYYHPDVLVAPRSEVAKKNLPVPPLLAVEVLSKTSRAHDLVRKRHVYARAGLVHYWIVDADAPWIMVLEREGDQFVEAAKAEGDELLVVDHPFPVSLRPSDLLGEEV